MPLNNVLRDEIIIKRYDSIPSKPTGLFPVNDSINPFCLTLKANAFSDPEGDTLQAAQWQISKDSINCRQ